MQTSNTVRSVLRIAVLAVGAMAAGSSHGQEPFTLEAAVRRAIVENPSVIAAEADIAAAGAIRHGASLFMQENPELEFATGTRRIGDEESVEYELGVAQTLDIAGQRSARKDAASGAFAAAEARLAERKAAVAAEVRETFGRVLAEEERQRLAEDALALAGEALAGAEARYEAGSASLIELNTARIEVGRNKRSTLAAERARTAAIADLRLLLAMSPEDPLSLAGELSSEAEPRDLEVNKLVTLAIERRPDLIAARHDLDSARGEQRLASREAVPLPKVGARYAKEEDAKIVLGFVSWDLPIFNRNQAGRGSSGARAQQLEAAVVALERQVAQEVALGVNRLRLARETLDGFTEADLAALDENVALTTEGYDAGQIDFLQVLLVRREMLEVRGSYIAAREEFNAAEAELDRVLGEVTGLAPGR